MWSVSSCARLVIALHVADQAQDCVVIRHSHLRRPMRSGDRRPADNGFRAARLPICEARAQKRAASPVRRGRACMLAALDDNPRALAARALLRESWPEVGAGQGARRRVVWRLLLSPSAGIASACRHHCASDAEKVRSPPHSSRRVSELQGPCMLVVKRRRRIAGGGGPLHAGNEPKTRLTAGMRLSQSRALRRPRGFEPGNLF